MTFLHNFKCMQLCTQKNSLTQKTQGHIEVLWLRCGCGVPLAETNPGAHLIFISAEWHTTENTKLECPYTNSLSTTHISIQILKHKYTHTHTYLENIKSKCYFQKIITHNSINATSCCNISRCFQGDKFLFLVKKTSRFPLKNFLTCN